MEELNEKPDIKKEEEKAKKLSIIEGSFYSVMEGFGQRYITPYALLLGASNFIVGFLASFPQLLGNLSQLLAIKLFKKYKRKKIVASFVFIQALSWFPIILTGFLYFYLKVSSKLATNLLIIFYTIIIIAGSAAAPFWNSWMKDIVKENRGEYFAKRNRIIGAVGIISMLAAGIIINFFGKENFLGFFIILLIAAIGRFSSGLILKRQYEHEFKFEESYYFSFIDFTQKMFYNNFGRFVIFVSLISFATAIASPFFAVYMLKNLNFSYLEFAIVSLITSLSTLLFIPFWGKFADKSGNINVLRITGIMIPLVPLGWVGTLLITPLNSKTFLILYLMAIETISGFAWSGFNLSAMNFIYDAVTRQRMTLCTAYYNLLNAFGIFIGGVLGSVISSQTKIIGIEPIIFVFLLSGILRFSLFKMTINKIKEVRNVENLDLSNELKSYLGTFLKGINRVYEKV